MSPTPPDLFTSEVDPAFAGVEAIEEPVRLRRDTTAVSDSDEAKKAALLFG